MRCGKKESAVELPQPAALRADSREHAVSKQEIVYTAMRDAILGRLIPADTRLPSTRTLAQRWGLSRGTVEAAYDRLGAEAYVTRVPGSGTHVCAVVPDRYLMATGTAPGHRVAALPVAARQHTLSTVVSNRGTLGEVGVQAGRPFVARLPDPALFSLPSWARHMARSLRRVNTDTLSSADPRGLPQLREQIAAYLRTYRGIVCSTDDIVVLTGIRHALDLLARSVLRAGDAVCVEDPCYPAARRIFAQAGAVVIPVPVDQEGLECARLEDHPQARLVYVTPAHQSPTGATMSVTRRLELIDWADRNGGWIIEDDYDSEFNYLNAPLAALKSLDNSGRVIYCGSFNKSLFAGLRVGFALVPAQLKCPLLTMWQTSGRSVGVMEQLTLASWMQDGAFIQHLRLTRRAYQARRDMLLAVLDANAPGCYTVSGQHAGFHFVLWLRAGSDEASFCARAAAAGLSLQGLRSLCEDVRLAPAVIVGYAALTMAQVRYGAQLLAQLLVQPEGEAR
ncbi:MocR-like pyridoxine biosynthesis transcription factor PdxR [Massilia sp. S19_KUP03_FR1]|uniref:MocR-like pyridoxine biosynthesis transcription factor PdxR n=1 Tax=Massilia sp. S19_KUP03_FR1 TaxID=3025503 RepID=UPI002FCD8A61